MPHNAQMTPVQNRFEPLLAAIILLLATYPYLAFLPPGLRPVVPAAVMLAALGALARSRAVLALGVPLAVAGIVSEAVSTQSPESVIRLVGTVCELGLYLLTIVAITPLVFRTERVNRDTISGGLIVYLLICVGFSSVYEMLAILDPGAFAFTSEAAADPDLLYFSFVTLTTLGYGDILPATDAAKSLVVVEAVIGILYPTMLISRLVSLWRDDDEAGPAPGLAPAPTGPRGRLEILFLSLVLLMFGYPYLSILMTAVATTAVLLASLAAVSRDRRSTITAAVLIAPALISLALSERADATSWQQIGRNLFSGTFLLFVTWKLGVAVFTVKSVSRDTLFGAASLYILVGLLWAHLYELIDMTAPGAFSVAFDGSLASRFGASFYFSFVTLTTLGYGDIVPLVGQARSAALLESTVGIVFPAVVVARLVTLYR